MFMSLAVFTLVFVVLPVVVHLWRRERFEAQMWRAYARQLSDLPRKEE